MNRRTPMIAGAVLLLALLAVFLVVLPKIDEVGETEDRLQETQDQEINLAAQLKSLDYARAAAPETELEIAAIDALVPPTAGLPSLFRLLQGAADRAAVDFFSFTPGTPVPNPTGSYSTVESQITVSGGYLAIDEFLFLLETSKRAAKVTALAVTPSAGGDGTTTTLTSSLQIQITVEFYTTDSSAGPGSIPGPTEGVSTTGV